jgi:hypothetical protein
MDGMIKLVGAAKVIVNVVSSKNIEIITVHQMVVLLL